MGAAAAAGMLYAVGGCATSSEFSRGVEAYNPSTRTWLKVTVTHHASVVAVSGHVVAVSARIVAMSASIVAVSASIVVLVVLVICCVGPWRCCDCPWCFVHVFNVVG